MLETIVSEVGENPIIKLVCLSIVGDTLFGVLRALMQREFNSSFGINGGIRKIGMVCGMLILFIADMVININLLPFVSPEVLEQMGLKDVGMTEFFGILFIAYEVLSILKNMTIMGLPLPKGIKTKVEEWLKSNTDEME